MIQEKEQKKADPVPPPPPAKPAAELDQPKGEDAKKAAAELGFPIIIRAAYTLGGQGSGFAYNMDQLETMATTAFSFSPQILVEESLKGWKEVEYEIVRDSKVGGWVSIDFCNRLMDRQAK